MTKENETIGDFAQEYVAYAQKQLRQDWAFKILLKLLDESYKAIDKNGVFHVAVDSLVETAYRLTDAMLAKREKPND